MEVTRSTMDRALLQHHAGYAWTRNGASQEFRADGGEAASSLTKPGRGPPGRDQLQGVRRGLPVVRSIAASMRRGSRGQVQASQFKHQQSEQDVYEKKNERGVGSRCGAVSFVRPDGRQKS